MSINARLLGFGITLYCVLQSAPFAQSATSVQTMPPAQSKPQAQSKPPAHAKPSAQANSQAEAKPSTQTESSAQREKLAAGPMLDEGHSLFDAIRRDEVFRVMRMLDTDFRNKQAPLHPVWGSLLHTAAAERAPQCLRYLLTRADQLVEAQNERGETALMLVAKHGDLSMAEQLLKRGGQINRQGWTPLHYAAAFDQRLMVDWLLDRDAYIDAESPANITPLMMAVRQGHEALAMHLVRQGADVSYRSHAGLTAMDYAQQMGRDDFAAWLLDRIR